MHKALEGFLLFSGMILVTIKLIEIIFDKNTNQQLELYLLPILNNTLNNKGVMNEKKR